MTTTMTVTPATVADATWLAPVAARLFRAAFADANDPDDLDAYLADAFHRDRIAEELARPDTTTLLAWDAERSGSGDGARVIHVASTSDRTASTTPAGTGAGAGAATAATADSRATAPAGFLGYAMLVAGPGAGVVANDPIEVHRLYVETARTSRGHGGRLMAVALDRAAAAGHDVAWLGVWEHNLRAIDFYTAHGFRQVGSHSFTLGSDVQTDLVLARHLP